MLFDRLPTVLTNFHIRSVNSSENTAQTWLTLISWLRAASGFASGSNRDLIYFLWMLHSVAQCCALSSDTEQFVFALCKLKTFCSLIAFLSLRNWCHISWGAQGVRGELMLMLHLNSSRKKEILCNGKQSCPAGRHLDELLYSSDTHNQCQ